jgi:hypothetical protein
LNIFALVVLLVFNNSSAVRSETSRQSQTESINTGNVVWEEHYPVDSVYFGYVNRYELKFLSDGSSRFSITIYDSRRYEKPPKTVLTLDKETTDKFFSHLLERAAKLGDNDEKTTRFSNDFITCFLNLNTNSSHHKWWHRMRRFTVPDFMKMKDNSADASPSGQNLDEYEVFYQWISEAFYELIPHNKSK